MFQPFAESLFLFLVPGYLYVLFLSIGFVVFVVAFGMAKIKIDLSIHPIYATALRNPDDTSPKECHAESSMLRTSGVGCRPP